MLSILLNAVFFGVIGIKLYNKLTVTHEDIPVSWLYQSRMSLFELFPQSNSDVIYLGASIIQYSNWNELLGDYNIKNRGIAGDTTTDILNRLAYIIEGMPEKIFIMVGLNDLLTGVSQDDIISNFHDIVKRIKLGAPQSKIYFYSVLPVVNLSIYWQSVNADILRLNSHLKDVCKSAGCVFIDLHSVFLTSEDELNRQFTYDGVHLNAAGYSEWQRVLMLYQ